MSFETHLPKMNPADAAHATSGPKEVNNGSVPESPVSVNGTPPLSADSMGKSDADPNLLPNAKSKFSDQPAQADGNGKKSTRLNSLSDEHALNPAEIDLKTVRTKYNYKALADAHTLAQESFAATQKKVARLTVSQKNLSQQLEKAQADETTPQEHLNALEDRHQQVQAKLANETLNQSTLKTHVDHLQKAKAEHSPMRTKYLGKCSTHFQSGIGVMNTAFLLLSIPSMFQMVRSFFPSSEKNDDQVAAPPPPQPSGAQSFQPRGIVNHQANLIRAQQQQMAQLPPSLQAAFLQGPVAASGGAQYPQYAAYPQYPQAASAA